MSEIAPCGDPIENARECIKPCDKVDLCINKRVEDLFYNLNKDKNENLPVND